MPQLVFSNTKHICCYCRATGDSPFKKVKRTRMNVDHLNEEEKRLRKRLLGRERARRYRERKRAVDSFFEARVGRSGTLERRPRVVRPTKKHSRKRKTRLAPLIRELIKGEGEVERQLTNIFPASSSSSSPSASSSSSRETNHHDLKGPVSIENPLSFPVRSLVGEDAYPSSDTNVEISLPTLEVPVAIEDSLEVDANVEVVCADVHVTTFHGTGSIGQPTHEGMELSDTHGTRNEKCFEPRISSTIKDSKSMDMTNPVNINVKLSLGDKDQMGSMETPPSQTNKKTFKQQNVKDFINLFPVEQNGLSDTKTSLGTGCNMQRQVEYVPSMKRSTTLKPNLYGPTTRASTTEADIVNRERTLDNKDIDGDTQPLLESVEARNTREGASSTLKPVEKLPTVTSVQLTPPQALPSVPQTSLTSVLPVSDFPLPLFMDSTSRQPLAMVGMPFTQTLHSMQMAGILQQQFINTAGNIQVLDAVDATGQPSTQGLQHLKATAGPPSIIGLPNLHGVGDIHGVPGIQGILGHPACQGVGGLKGIASLQHVQGLLGGISGISGLQGVTNLSGVGCLQSIPGVQGPSSPSGFAGLHGVTGFQGYPNVVPSFQGIPNFQAAVPGLQGIPGLQGVTGLQGLVSLQALSALQGTQGVGIQGAMGLQTLAGLQGITGISTLTPGFSVPPGTLGQLGSIATVGQECVAGQQKVIGQGAKDRAGVSPITGEMVINDPKENQHSPGADKDER